MGLGNPGPEYADTRHNVGFLVVERFAARHGIALGEPRSHGAGALAGRLGRGDACGREVAVLEPWTWMNRSGSAVARALEALGWGEPSRQLAVVYDDIDLPFGRLRVRPEGGAGGHRGVQSIIDALATREFARLRFGVGRPPGDGDAVEHVLARFDAEEEAALPAHLERAVDALEALLADGVQAAMNRFNRNPAQERDERMTPSTREEEGRT